MKYFLSQIFEQHGEFKHQTIIRFQANNLDEAKQKQIYWANHWYPIEDERATVECRNGEYQYDSGSVAVATGFCHKVSKATYMELKELIVEM